MKSPVIEYGYPSMRIHSTPHFARLVRLLRRGLAQRSQKLSSCREVRVQRKQGYVHSRLVSHNCLGLVRLAGTLGSALAVWVQSLAGVIRLVCQSWVQIPAGGSRSGLSQSESMSGTMLPYQSWSEVLSPSCRDTADTACEDGLWADVP